MYAGRDLYHTIYIHKYYLYYIYYSKYHHDAHRILMRYPTQIIILLRPGIVGRLCPNKYVHRINHPILAL